MDQLGISKELPAADETDPEMQPIVTGTRSNPGHRTPGRPTMPAQGGPPSKNRVSSPGSKPGLRTSNPNVRSSQPGAKPPTRPPRPPSQAPAHPTAPPAESRAGLFIGIAAFAVVVIGAVAFLLVRNANKRVDVAAQEAAARAAKITAAQVATKQSDEETPVFLSVISEPLGADVVATWKDGGEKKGAAPISLEVPKNAKVHFQFSKPGYVGYAMDVIADQAQSVRAELQPNPVTAEPAVDKKPPHGKKRPDEKKAETPPSKDGVIDLDDALK